MNDVRLTGYGRAIAVLAGTFAIGALASAILMSVAAGSRPIPPALIPAISGVLLVVASILAWQVRRQWVLLSEGRQAIARVTGYKTVHRDKHTAYDVSATFQDLSGATRSMKYEVRKAPPAAGTTVRIVYHRDDPRWNAVYPLRFVRPIRDSVSGSDRSARTESRGTAAVPPGRRSPSVPPDRGTRVRPG